MTKQFRTAEEAVVYMTECALATVENMAMRKRFPVGEFNRQVDIAQAGVTFIRNNRITSSGRVAEVISDFNGEVALWDKSL